MVFVAMITHYHSSCRVPLLCVWSSFHTFTCNLGVTVFCNLTTNPTYTQELLTAIKKLKDIGLNVSFSLP